jgi:hypothetical protein
MRTPQDRRRRVSQVRRPVVIEQTLEHTWALWTESLREPTRWIGCCICTAQNEERLWHSVNE